MIASLHSKIPHVVSVLVFSSQVVTVSDNVVTILSPSSGTGGRLQNHVPVLS